MAERVAVVGTGTWGTTLAIAVARGGIPSALCCRTETEADALRQAGANINRLPECPFPPGLAVTAHWAEAIETATAVFLAVPAQHMRWNARRVRPHLSSDALILSCAKGLELTTLQRMSQVVAEEIPEAAPRIAVLSGPNLAREIAAGLPATSVVAAFDRVVAARLRALLMTPAFRVYTNPDPVGVELAGALKNIIALGAGFCDGLGLGNNAKAAFIGRGLAEITRLGVAAGARQITFSGLAGLGDIIATCASPQSRNRHVGEQLARGRALAEVQSEMSMVAEGVTTTRAARALAQRFGVEMPIVELTYAVLFKGKDPRQALRELMTRDPKDEWAAESEAPPP